MESRNPDTELPDTRSMTEKLKDDGNEINADVNDQVKSSGAENKNASDITDDEAKELAGSAPRLEQLISDLGQYGVKSVEDLRRIEEIVNRYELYKKYGE